MDRLIRSRLSSEHGVTLIETLISAVILVIVVGAVLTTIDASGRTTTVNKNRSVAAVLAEQDQERLRAMSPTALDGHTRTEKVPVDGVEYTVQSRSEWMFDASGATASCENQSGQAEYLRISSTVTSSVVGTRVKPVTMRSIVAPRADSFPENSGTLTVKVTDQLGEPVPGMRVTITPAGAPPRVTNEFGCAVFAHIQAGSYKATLDTFGWVDEEHQRLSETPTAVVNVNKTTNVGMTYAKAAAIDVRFKTDTGTGPIDSFAHAVTVANDDSTLVPTPVATPLGSMLVTNLFPHPDGYTAYAGRCERNDPAHPDYSPANDAYVATGPGFTSVAPGLTSVVEVHQPSVNLKVVAPNGAPLAGEEVTFTPISGCGSVSGTTKFVRVVGDDGFMLDRGLPFGDYTACVDRRVGFFWYSRQLSFQSRTPTGTPVVSVALGSGSGEYDTRARCAT